MGPINYKAQLHDPSRAAFEGYATGLNMRGAEQALAMNAAAEARARQLHPLAVAGAELGMDAQMQNMRIGLDENNRAERRLALGEQQFQQQTAEQAGFQRAMAELADLQNAATFQDYAQIAARYPEFADAAFETWDLFDDNRRAGMSNVMGQVAFALQAGNSNRAIKLLGEYVSAAERSGDVDGALSARAVRDAAKADPRAALAGVGATLAVVNPDLAKQVFGETSAAEQKIARLQETGLSREQAIAIAEGRHVTSRDPVSGQAVIIDKATGQTIDSDPAAVEAVNGLPGLAPITTTQIDSDKDILQQPQSSMPEGVDFSTATGARGFGAQLANTLTDAIGLGLVDQNNERATQAMNNLATRTMVAMSGAVAGRPSNYLLEQFERLAARPNSVFMGEGRTLERLTQTRDMISAAIQENMALTQSNAVSPTLRGQAGENIQRLGLLLQDYNAVIDGFGQSLSGQGQTSGGVTWRVVE